MPQRLMMAIAASLAAAAAAAAEGPSAANGVPVFRRGERAVSTWRAEAAGHLVLTVDQVAALKGPGIAPRVARCVKLNNYWCIKSAGWDGELAADEEGHVAFASAVEGAAVAALLLKRYYVDFGRRSATAIIAHWAPAQCGISVSALRAGDPARPPPGPHTTASHVRRAMPAPAIAVGLGLAKRPMTLDALMTTSRDAPPSRSMIGMPRPRGARPSGFGTAGCAADPGRTSAYAAKAAAGIETGAEGDLGLFDADGVPTPNLAIMMVNMSRVEIGPLGPTPELIEAGIASAFRPGRNPPKQ